MSVLDKGAIQHGGLSKGAVPEPGKTPVSNSIQLVWDTIGQIDSSSQLIWNVGEVGPMVGVQALWNVHTDLETTTQFLWSLVGGEFLAFPFFVKGEDPDTLESALPFFSHGSTGSGFMASLPFYAYTDESGMTPSLAIPFYLAGADQGNTELALPFFAEGGSTFISKGVDFYALGPSGIEEGIPFYTAGLGTTDGAIPIEQSINFYIKRPFAEYLPFYVLGPGTAIESGIPFYTAGAETASGETIEFSVPQVVGLETLTLDFYTHGF